MPCSVSFLGSGNRAIRDSWQTTGSAATYLEGLNIVVPDSPAHIDHPSRLSIGSIATFMTDSSADAVIPRNQMPTFSARRSSNVRKSRPVSIYTVTDDGPWSDGDEDLLESCIFGELNSLHITPNSDDRYIISRCLPYARPPIPLRRNEQRGIAVERNPFGSITYHSNFAFAS